MANLGNLLFEDHPLMCSPQLAALFGSADEAIILQQIHYWLKRSGKMQKDGHEWFYNSMSDWMKQFPWIQSRKRLSRYFDDLEDRGLILTGNFNTAKFDKTKWYRIDYDALKRLDDRMGQNDPIDKPKSDNDVPKTDNRMGQDDPTNGSKRPNGMGQNDPTYTRDYTETTTETTGNVSQLVNADARQNSADKPGELKSFALWEHNWGWPNSVNTQDLTDWVNEFGDELVSWTIEYALRRNVASFKANSWLRKAFDSYRRENVKTVEQAEAKAEAHRQQVEREVKGQRRPNRYGRKQRVEKLPEWAKDQQPSQSQQIAPPEKDREKPSEEQLAESKRLLEELKNKQRAGAKSD